MSDDIESNEDDEAACIIIPYFVDDSDRSWADDLPTKEINTK